MDPNFWHGLWSRGHIGFHQHDFNKHMQSFVTGLDAPPGGHIFVPLCGKSLDMIWLLEQGYRVTGVEISKRAVEDFFTENGLSYDISTLNGTQLYSSENLVIYCADFFEVELTHTAQIDAVYDRASLIALPQTTRPAYVNRLTSLLNPGTRSLLVTLDYPQQQMSGPPFSVTPLEVEELFGELYEIKKIHSEDCLANEPRFIKKGLTRLEEHVFLLKKNR